MTLFLNPSSKNGRGMKNWPHFLGRGFAEIVTQNGADMIKKVAADENGAAVAVGGDGTINMVVNGIMRSGRQKVLGVLYSGTSPDFCKFHGIPTAPAAAMDVLERNKTYAIDVCKITRPRMEAAYFLSSCNMGLGAKIARAANRIRKYLGDTLGTLAAAIYALATTRAFRADVELDGMTLGLEKIRHISVLKNNNLASGLRLNIDCRPDDGFIYFVAAKRLGLLSLLALYRGKIPKGATVRRCRKLRIATDPIQRIEYDGDPHFYGNVEIECLHKALELIR